MRTSTRSTKPYTIQRPPSNFIGDYPRLVRVRETRAVIGTVEKRALNVYAFFHGLQNPTIHASIVAAAEHLYRLHTTRAAGGSK